MNMNQNRRISHLESNINNLHFSHGNEVRNLQWTLSSQIEAINSQIYQMSRVTFDETINVISYNPQTLSAGVEIGFNLREFGANDEVRIVARGGSGQVIETVANQSASGRFAATMALPLQDNFAITFASTGATVTTGSLMEVSLADELCNRFRVGFSVGYSSTPRPASREWNTDITLTPSLSNFTNGNELLELRSVVFYTMHYDSILQEWDITSYLRSQGTHETIEMWDYWQSDGFTIQLDENDDEYITALRVVMYDNLGIRYEQMDKPDMFRVMAAAGRINIPAPMHFATPWVANHSSSRVIFYGQDSWNFVHMVVPVR